MNILRDHVTTERTNVSHDQIPESLSMDIKGKKRVISAAYGINNYSNQLVGHMIVHNKCVTVSTCPQTAMDLYIIMEPRLDSC